MLSLSSLVGVLGAPFPFIVGIHASFLKSRDCSFAPETVRVFLDNNLIDFGALGQPPALPERRAKKLMQVILSTAPVFSHREEDWNITRKPYFDHLFSVIATKQFCPTDEGALRAGFLKFFVAILKNYRKYVCRLISCTNNHITTIFVNMCGRQIFNLL